MKQRDFRGGQPPKEFGGRRVGNSKVLEERISGGGVGDRKAQEEEERPAQADSESTGGASLATQGTYFPTRLSSEGLGSLLSRDDRSGWRFRKVTGGALGACAAGGGAEDGPEGLRRHAGGGQAGAEGLRGDGAKGRSATPARSQSSERPLRAPLPGLKSRLTNRVTLGR